MAVNEVALTRNVSLISVSQSETMVSATGAAPATVVTQTQAPTEVSVGATAPAVAIQQGQAEVVQVVATGPQGPPFTGANFFNVDAIASLGVADTGKVVAWDGTEFQPTNILENDLTISGGAF